jgi:NAD(P)-dependent dehydrogenase (short-subunit alcohol dehydrogenase family)
MIRLMVCLLLATIVGCDMWRGGPLPGQAVYGAAKAFVLSYTHALRAELRGTGVTASVLCPGPVHTGFGERAGFSDAEVEALDALRGMTDGAAISGMAATSRTLGDGLVRGHGAARVEVG